MKPMLFPQSQITTAPFHSKIRFTVWHLFNGVFSRTTWVNWHKEDKQFWILTKEEMTGWLWYQLNHMQIICILLPLLQTDNHTSTSSLNFCWLGTINSVKALKATYCLLLTTTTTTTTVLRPLDSVWDYPVSRYQKGKTRKVKLISIYWSKI